MTQTEEKHPGATGDREFPIVLILDRDLAPAALLNSSYRLVDQTPPHDFEQWFHWTDTCGSRAVWYWAPEHQYSKAAYVHRALRQSIIVSWTHAYSQCSAEYG